MPVTIAPLGDGDVAPVAAAVAAWQTDPTHDVCFVGDEAGEVAEEFAGEPAWRDRTYVATDDEGAVVGAVLASVDEDMGRVWWFGPWGVSQEVRRALVDAASAALPHGVDQFEYGPDQRNEAVARLAEDDGCTPGTPSSVLVLDPLVVPAERRVGGVEVVAVGAAAEADAPGPVAAVAALHDEIFRGTHTTGETLVAAPDSEVLAAVEDGAVLGYVATEEEPGGAVYIDYLGTSPQARRRGVAAALITEALRRRASRGASRAFLTVRTDATGARALYLSLGFREERVIVPWRRGFDLG